MEVSSAIYTASSGIIAVNNQLAVVANNIANQNTVAYATEVANQSAVVADGSGMGVVSTATTRDIDLTLQGTLLAQNAAVQSLSTQSTSLSAIDAASGTTGAGNDLPSLLGDLQDSFTSLSASPDSGAAQSEVVSAASTLASGINNISDAIGTQRQNAQNNIVTGIGTLNKALAQIGSLNSLIASNQAAGGSVAALENQRDISEQAISNLIDAKFVTEPDGAVQVITGSGTILPTDGTALVTSNTTITAGSTYPNDIPAITLDGVDVTSSLTGGSIGGAITLRDSTLPARQAELDEFSEQLATRFDAQGLTLFTDGSSNVPAAGSPTQTNYVGFAGTITVNPAVSVNVSLVRDGTHNVTGSATGAAAFSVNSAGTAGFTTLINNILNYTFGADVQSGVPQPAVPTSGLGAEGSTAIAYNPGGTLSSFISALSSNDATEVANSTSRLTDETDTQTTLNNQLSAGSAVSVDAQMSDMVQLQNAYAANAKILSSVQSMWTDLMGAINPS